MRVLDYDVFVTNLDIGIVMTTVLIIDSFFLKESSRPTIQAICTYIKLKQFHPYLLFLCIKSASDIAGEERWIFMRCQTANRLESCPNNGSQEMPALI